MKILMMGVGKTSTHLQCGTQAKISPCKQQTGPFGRVVGQGLCGLTVAPRDPLECEASPPSRAERWD